MSLIAETEREVPKLHALNKGFAWIDARREGLRRLSLDEVDRFDRDGFFVHRDAFTPEEIATVTRAIDPLEARLATAASAEGLT